MMESKQKETVNTHIRKVRCNCKKKKCPTTTSTTLKPEQMIYNDFQRATIALRNQLKMNEVKEKLKIILAKYLRVYIENLTLGKKTNILELIKSSANAKDAFETIKDYDEIYIKNYNKELKENVERQAADLIIQMQPLFPEKVKQSAPTARAKRADVQKQHINQLKSDINTYLNIAKTFFVKEITKYAKPLLDKFSSKSVKNNIYVELRNNNSESFPMATKNVSILKTLRNSTNSKRKYEKIVNYTTIYIKNYFNKEKKERLGKELVKHIIKIQPLILQELMKPESDARLKRGGAPKERVTDYVKMRISKIQNNNSYSKRIHVKTTDYSTIYINNHYHKEIEEIIRKEVVDHTSKIQPYTLQEVNKQGPKSRVKREELKERNIDYLKRSKLKTLKNNNNSINIYQKIMDYGSSYIRNHYNKQTKERIRKEILKILSNLQPFIIQELKKPDRKTRVKREKKPKKPSIEYVKRHYLDIIEFIVKKFLTHIRHLFDTFASINVAKDYNGKLLNYHFQPQPNALTKISRLKSLNNSNKSEGKYDIARMKREYKFEVPVKDYLNIFKTVKHNTNSKKIFEKTTDYATTYTKNDYNKETEKHVKTEEFKIMSNVHPFINQQVKKTETKAPKNSEFKPMDLYKNEKVTDYVKLSMMVILKNNTNSEIKYDIITEHAATYIKKHNIQTKAPVRKGVIGFLRKMQPFILQNRKNQDPKARVKREDKPIERFIDYVKTRIKPSSNYIKIFVKKYMNILLEKFLYNKIANDLNEQTRNHHSEQKALQNIRVSDTQNNNYKSKGILHKNIIDHSIAYINTYNDKEEEIKERIRKYVAHITNKIDPLPQFHQTESNTRVKREQESVVRFIARHIRKYKKIVEDFVKKEILTPLQPLFAKYPPKIMMKDFHDSFKNKSIPDSKVYFILEDTLRHLREGAFGVHLNYDEIIPKYTFDVLGAQTPGSEQPEYEIRPKWDHFKFNKGLKPEWLKKEKFLHENWGKEEWPRWNRYQV